MRLLHLYLIAYFLLLAGAALALWQAGILQRVAGPWLALAALIVVGLGLLLVVTSARPPVAEK